MGTQIFAFDHPHQPGDICSVKTCEYARRHPVLAGTEVFSYIPQRIIRKATKEEYLRQPLQPGEFLPPLVYGYKHIYEVETLPCQKN